MNYRSIDGEGDVVVVVVVVGVTLRWTSILLVASCY